MLREPGYTTGHDREALPQLDLLRDIFGNPSRSVPVDPSWLAWNDRTVLKLAQAIYAEQAFDGLPILADALEEAGCVSSDLLAHCRSAGPHVRGCWVVDCLLGQERRDRSRKSQIARPT
jgi:hypothetical protein